MKSCGNSRLKILICAKELFYLHGYQGASVDDIIRKTGVAKSNFYYHFESKEQLAVAVLEMRIEDLNAVISETLENARSTPADQLSSFLSAIVRSHNEFSQVAGCPFGNFAASLPTSQDNAQHERFRAILSSLFYRLEAVSSVCFSAGIEQGYFKQDLTAPEMASLLVTTLQGLFILAKAHQDSHLVERGFEVFSKIVISA